MSDHTNRGENPFEKIARARGNRPAPSGNYRMDRLQARLAAAQAQADKQRALGYEALEHLNPPKAEFEPEIQRLLTKPIPRPSVTKKAWVSAWGLIWLTMTLVMMSGNLLGGLLLSIPLFFVCIFFANAPQIYANTFADGRGRNNHGAAV